MSGAEGREEFEAWAHPQQLHTGYPAVVYETAWTAWQASRSQALEDAAEIARKYKGGFFGSGSKGDWTCLERIADAILALKKGGAL